MMPLTLGDIATITRGVVHGDPALLVSGEVVIDSRKAGPGGLFVAVVGERVDGHLYAVAAVAAGAAGYLGTREVLGAGGVPGVVVEDVVEALAALARHVLSRLPSVVIAGITGSSGKTSVKDLAAQLVERLGPTIAPAGSFNTEYGLPLTILRADESTRYLVLEMSARGTGHIAYLCQIAPPRYGVELNVGRAHAGGFGGLDQVALAKGELVEALPADGVAILNADDPRVAVMASRTRATIRTFGMNENADVTASDVRLDELGRASFTLVMAEGSAAVSLRLHGAHQVPNALAAAALAASMGLPLAEIAAGLSAAVRRSRHRMEVTTRPDGVVVVDDAYNANPESVRAALDAVRHLAASGSGRGFAILGGMAELGSLSREAHEEIGSYAAAAGLAGVIAVGDPAAPVLDGVRQVPSFDGLAAFAPDGEAALKIVTDQLRPGDVVLVKASNSVALWLVAAGLLAEGNP
jgi:UDP-N-acetylmuramoyl-tripeptide--D-alanyl-D-alanine ligase